MSTTFAASLLVAALSLAACASAAPAPADPMPSLQHDTDVVRLARPNRRMFLVDVIRPPLPTPDPVLTNEVDTSADSDLPRLVRVLIPAPEEPEEEARDATDEDYLPRPAPADGVVGLVADTERLTRLLPPAADQQTSAADWGPSSPTPDQASATQKASVSEELLPPPAGEADLSEWTKQAAQPRADVDGAPAEAVKEPSAELQPPEASYAGLWELFEGLKMVQADGAVAETKGAATDSTVDAKETPVTELVPPRLAATGDVDFWTKPSAAQARADEAKERPAVVVEPASDLVPPASGQPDLSEWTRAAIKTTGAGLAGDQPTPDSYAPEKPSSGDAGRDDFLSLGAPAPAAALPSDAVPEYVKDHSDSYLPEAGELKLGPVFDDFLAIGEPPKEDEDKEDEKKEDEKDSYTPDESSSSASKEDSSSADSSAELTPPHADETQPSSAEDIRKSGTAHVHAHDHGHGHEHVHDHVHATTPRPSPDEGDNDHDHDLEADDDDGDVKDDGVNRTRSTDPRKKRHICRACGGFARAPIVSVVINKGGYGGGGGGGYCDVCGRPVYQPEPVYQPQPVYRPAPVYHYQQPVCNVCNQPAPPPPPPPPPCNICGGGGGGGGGNGYSYSQSSSSSSASSSSGGWAK